MTTEKFTPTIFDSTHSTYDSLDSSHPTSNVIGSDETSETFARFYMTKGGVAFTEIYYGFDLSSIPENATINRVSCSAKGRMENSSTLRAGNNTIALTHNQTTVIRSESITVFGTSASVHTLTTTDFTREQLNALHFRFFGSRGYIGTNTSYYMDLFGVSVEIEYTIPEEPKNKLHLKVNGQWASANKVYKKMNGAWTEQTDLTQIFDENVKYIRS